MKREEQLSSLCPVCSCPPPGWQFFGDSRANHRAGGEVASLGQEEKAETAQCDIFLLHSY